MTLHYNILINVSRILEVCDGKMSKHEMKSSNIDSGARLADRQQRSVREIFSDELISLGLQPSDRKELLWLSEW